jgi:transposase
VIDGIFFRTRAGCPWRDLPERNIVERAFGQLRQHRAVATRYDKRDYVWRGTIDVASIRIWLRPPTHDLRDTL